QPFAQTGFPGRWRARLFFIDQDLDRNRQRCLGPSGRAGRDRLGNGPGLVVAPAEWRRRSAKADFLKIESIGKARKVIGGVGIESIVAARRSRAEADVHRSADLKGVEFRSGQGKVLRLALSGKNRETDFPIRPVREDDDGAAYRSGQEP